MGILLVAHMIEPLVVLGDTVLQFIFSNNIFRQIAVLCCNQCICDQITGVLARGSKEQPASSDEQQKETKQNNSG
ncbi:hypothetical protein D3C81_1709650 [compost metagenome]